jgi:hypothetical protein
MIHLADCVGKSCRKIGGEVGKIMWGQPPSPALSGAEGAVRRAQLDAFLTPTKAH